jgi:hypothetical protein
MKRGRREKQDIPVSLFRFSPLFFLFFPARRFLFFRVGGKKRIYREAKYIAKGKNRSTTLKKAPGKSAPKYRLEGFKTAVTNKKDNRNSCRTKCPTWFHTANQSGDEGGDEGASGIVF